MGKILIDKLALIEIKDRRILVSLNKGAKVWYTPGGQRENGESNEQALIREIKEELSVDIEPNTIKYFAWFEAPSHDRPDELLVRITCYTASYSGVLKPSAEIEKIDYFSYRQRFFVSTVDKSLFDDLKKRGFIE